MVCAVPKNNYVGPVPICDHAFICRLVMGDSRWFNGRRLRIGMVLPVGLGVRDSSVKQEWHSEGKEGGGWDAIRWLGLETIHGHPSRRGASGYFQPTGVSVAPRGGFVGRGQV